MGSALLTDPVTRARVGPLRRVEPVPARDGCAGVDAVLISHLHWDHLDVPSLRAPRRATCRSSCRRARGPGCAAAGFERRQRDRASAATASDRGRGVRAVEALHSGFRPPLGPTAPALGFVLRGSRSVYFAGDTDLCEAMWSLGDDRPRAHPGLGLGADAGSRAAPGSAAGRRGAAPASGRGRPCRSTGARTGRTRWAASSRSDWWSRRRRSWSTPRSWRRTCGCCRPRSAMRWRWTRSGVGPTRAGRPTVRTDRSQP